MSQHRTQSNFICHIYIYIYIYISPSVIVAYESLRRPRCEKMDLKIIQSLLERVQIHKNAGAPKNLWNLKDFSEEQQTV